MILTLLLTSMLTVVFNVRPVKAESVEPPATEWSRTYGGINDDFAVRVIQTADGGYAFFGQTFSFGGGEVDMWLIKIDAYGNMEWNKTYGGTGKDLCSSGLQTADGGFVLAGSTISEEGGWDIWLVKTDGEGNMQWNKTYGGTGIDVVEGERSIVQTSDGGYTIAGYTLSFEPPGIWLIKTDATGNLQWSQTFEPWWTAESIIQTDDGGYAIAGSASTVFYGFEFLLVKTDSTGEMQWYKMYGNFQSYYDIAYSLVQTTDGGYALAGRTDRWGYPVFSDIWLIKTDINGEWQWSKTYGGAYDDGGNSLVQTSDRGYAIAGFTASIGAGGAWLIKTDSAGNVHWNMTFGGTGGEDATSVIRTADGGYALAGNTWSLGAGGSDFWLMKLARLPDDVPPTADAGPDQTVYEDTLVTFDGSGSSDNVGIVSYMWTFVDGTPQTLTGVNPTYTFTTPGIYTVTLDVSDAAGNHATDTLTITVLSFSRRPHAKTDRND